MSVSPRLQLVAGPSHEAIAGPRIVVQLAERRLLIDGQPVALQARALDLLVALAGQPGRLVTRQALLDTVWAGRVVEDGNLNVQITALRRLLGSAAVATVPGYGYRLQVEVVLSGPGSAAPPAPAADTAPVHTPTGPRSHLPMLLAPLVAREADLAALHTLLDAQALVTLTGGAGVGKTRVAQALLHARAGRSAQSVCFVDLSALSDGAAVPGAIAAALGTRLMGAGDEVAQLVQQLEPLDLLLALDNAEHLLDAVAEVASGLLARAPRLRLLVTSQAPLRLAGEWLYRLGALAWPQAPCSVEQALQCGAVALFDLRAKAHSQAFRLGDDNLAQVVELCRRLDGIPLAIELAAARAPLVGLPVALAALDQRLGWLSRKLRDATPRHRSLRAALEWSHDLLGPGERRVFRRLAVFEGSFSLDAALQVLEEAPEPVAAAAAAGMAPADEPLQLIDTLADLIERSLVALVGSAEHARYRLLESPRALAWEALRAAGEEAALRERHARAMHRVFVGAREQLLGGTQRWDDFQQSLAPDLDNARAALRWALDHDATVAVGLASTITRSSELTRWAEQEAMWAKVLPLLDGPAGLSLPAPLRAAALEEYVQCIWHRQRAQALDCMERAVHLLGPADPPRDRFIVQARWAWMLGAMERDAEYSAALASMHALLDPAWSPYLQRLAVSAQAWQPAQQQDFDAALALKRREAALMRAAGMDDAPAFIHISSIECNAGRLDDAIATVQAVLPRLQDPGRASERMFAMGSLVSLLFEQGRAPQMRAALVDIWPLVCQFGYQAFWADDAALLAWLEQRPLALLRLQGHADARHASRRSLRAVSDDVVHKRAHDWACAALDPATREHEVAALLAEGAALTDAALLTLGLSIDAG